MGAITLQLVAARADDLDGDLVARLGEPVLYPVGLPKRQLTAARTDHDIHDSETFHEVTSDE